MEAPKPVAVVHIFYGGENVMMLLTMKSSKTQLEGNCSPSYVEFAVG